jgi:glycosyltransferase involved in cell wall biosynthesis
VIIVNNNSRDDTRAVALDFAATRPYIRVLDEMMQGRGQHRH